MNLDVTYYGRSGFSEGPSGNALSFQPNLARGKVFFDQQLKHPLRFREAISALHEVVVGNLKFQKKDKSAYEAWKKQKDQEENEIRRVVHDQAKKAELARITNEPIPANLEADFRRLHDVYWRERRKWASELSANDPELFRHLVPCDPVVTVAPDVVFFEAFAKDESSYGCLYVDRDAFVGQANAGLGTTNVDYSIALYEHFQNLRTYRPTRLAVDPSGFEVKVSGHSTLREEKIDLPTSWLRGFSQIQGAMGLPARTVELSTDVVYSILATLKRKREKTGPRSLKFQLTPGKAPIVVMEPWGTALQSRGAAYVGEKSEELKVWGRRRLMVLSRLLPLAEKVVVQVLGSGLPSIWTVHLGEMRFVLALSGWTENDWTGGAALELLAGDLRPEPRAMDTLSRHLATVHKAKLSELAPIADAPRDVLLGSLHALAKQGQVIYDHAAGAYRWRQVMPVALSESVIGEEPPEIRAGRELAKTGAVKVVREEPLSGARRLVVAKADSTEFEGILDADGVLTKAKCHCTHFRKYGLRKGPCRHLLALRLAGRRDGGVDSALNRFKEWLH
jgi:hypothetical protein